MSYLVSFNRGLQTLSNTNAFPLQMDADSTQLQRTISSITDDNDLKNTPDCIYDLAGSVSSLLKVKYFDLNIWFSKENYKRSIKCYKQQ